MKNFKLLIIVLFIISSCNYPVTKEKYLSEYETFIDEVKQNYPKYNDVNWKEKDKEFSKFNDKLYQKLKGKLTPTEQIRIKRFDFVYNLVRGNITLSDLASGKYNQIISDNLTELKSVFNEVTLFEKDIEDVISADLLNKLLDKE